MKTLYFKNKGVLLHVYTNPIKHLLILALLVTFETAWVLAALA